MSAVKNVERCISKNSDMNSSHHEGHIELNNRILAIVNNALMYATMFSQYQNVTMINNLTINQGYSNPVDDKMCQF